ncbi:MAG: nucleotidyl transferase AbiEii/AbiGii toxin family protein [Lachnospiraceae bacterium]|nr:nucleotidyl transferase AbiEii/AbiGii toxin family protein [Lachnospiraceae bacterium]
MNAALDQMLKAYDADDLYGRENAVKEIIQEIVLCGLSRAGFFRKAAFYGGTALRIFYGLDRFSEDLDFSLQAEDSSFDLKEYFPVLGKEVRSFGLNMEITEKKKTKDSNIRSASIKGNTKEHLLLFYPEDQAVRDAAKNELIKVKFEVDVSPPEHASFEHKYRLLPSPYEVTLYDMPSLFAGKIHAVLARAWKNRIKGRDLYDYVFYLSRGAAVNLPHLQKRLQDSGTVLNGTDLSLERVKEMLNERFESIDYAQAKRDVDPFIRDPASLKVWSAEFFRQITEGLREAQTGRQ